MATANFNISNNVVDNASFALLRTNPKFTSNVKLVVDSEENLYLSAFKANKSLSRIEYQKKDVKPNGNYSTDVSKFYRSLPLNERYFTLRKLSDLTAYSEYSAQYEDQYHYGATFNTTKLYEEQYKLLAPIWLDKKIPSNFIIYRVKDTDYSKNYTTDNLGQNNRILELLKNATIVKNYSLKRGSNLGDYLYNHVYSSDFPATPISFNFDVNSTIFYNGIDIKQGGFTSKKQIATKDYLIVDQPEIFANEYLTSGFEKNGIISANLINLEFLFDDITADNYNIYRYFGLYVDDYDEGSFDIDKVTTNGLMYIKPGSYETNYDLTGTELNAEDMLPNPSDLEIPTLNYIKDKLGKFHHIKNNIKFDTHKLPVSVNGSLDNLSGYTSTGNIVETQPKKPSSRGFLKLTINSTPNINDRVFIADKTELKISKYNLGDYVILADPTLSAGIGIKGRFSSQGTTSQIAIALANAIKLGEILTYKTTVIKNSIIIEDNSAGYNRKRTAFGIYKDNVNDFIEVVTGKLDSVGLTDSNPEIQDVLESNTVFADWDIFTPVGGAKEGAVFTVDQNELGNIAVGQWLKTKNLNQYTEIKEITKDPYNTNTWRVIVNKPINVSNDNLIEIYELHKIKHGKFSAYNLKDFNFDFYDTSNSNLGDLIYEVNKPESDLNPNTYFDGLTPVLNADDIDDTTEIENIESEYDRLDENNLKETAIRSRVVPTIMKFALKDASNARNLPYILNVNEAFGPDNLSPNINITSGRNPENLNMEHFHINKIPSYFYIENTLTGLDSYTSFANSSNGISIDQLKSTDIDYFTMYFTRVGNFNDEAGVWVDDSSKKLYSKFSAGSSFSNPTSVFRGLRYIYKKRKEYLKTAPTDFINSTEVNNYRFGVTFNYEFGNSNTVSYNVIKNDVYNFICVVLNLTVILDTKYIDLDRCACYNLVDIFKDNTTIEDTNIPFLIQLGYDLNDESYNFNDGLNPLYAARTAVERGNAKFTQYIEKNNEGVYSWIVFNTISGAYGMKVVDVIDDTQIVIDGKPKGFDVETDDNGKITRIDGPVPNGAPLDDPQSVPINTEYIYWKGGAGGYKNLLEEIVAYNFVDRFNKFGDINYLTIDETGEYPNRFVLEVEDGTEIVKASLVTKKTDAIKPKSYQLLSDEIGKVIKLRDDGGYFTTLRRMNGNYIPLFKDIITFGDIFSEQKVEIINNIQSNVINTANLTNPRKFLIYNKFNNLGVAFESYKLIGQTSNQYGFMKNVFYHKVNDENVKNLLKLSQTSDKLPLYPAIGEIAIDKKNINVLKSKYDATYFTKNLPASRSVDAHGTLSPVEVKSFMASTVMKVKDIYELTSFSSISENSLEDLDYIRVNSLNKAAIHWTETDAQIFADFYLPSSIIDELLEDGIRDVFKNYIKAENSFRDKDSIDDDLRQYIISNIVNRFIIDEIEIYGIKGKNIGSEFISITNPRDLRTGGYLNLTNYEIQRYQNDSLSFRLIYNKKLGYQYKLKVYIKIEA